VCGEKLARFSRQPVTTSSGPEIGTKTPGDDEILVVARRDRRVLVALDKDFGELAIVRRIPHSGSEW